MLRVTLILSMVLVATNNLSELEQLACGYLLLCLFGLWSIVEMWMPSRST